MDHTSHPENISASGNHIIIVGAGPSGLWLACELKRAGVGVTIVERRNAPIAQSRALTIHARTLEIFSLRGLADTFIANAVPIPAWHFGGLKKELSFSSFDAAYPYMLFIPQTKTEELLRAHALMLGVSIKMSHQVSAVVQHADGVVVQGTNESGDFSMQAKYVVGADGARSIVRQAAGISFDGLAPTKTMMMADARLNLSAHQRFSVINEHGAVSIIPLGNGLHRIICADPEQMHIDKQTPLTAASLAKSIQTIAGHGITIDQAVWLTRFTNETKIASSYRNQRLFLIGDAAHIHAPMGGQGLNVGIQDAMNLGWKMALVAKRLAPEALLDSYESERLPIGKKLFDNTLVQSRLATDFSPENFALRSLMEELLSIADVNQKLAGELSGLSLAYTDQLRAQSNQGPDAHYLGKRVADEEFTLPHDRKVRLYHFMEQGSYLLLRKSERAKTELHHLQEVGVQALTVDFSSSKQFPPDCAAVLIRPDGYIEALFY